MFVRVVAYLVVGLDVELDLLASEGSHSVHVSASLSPLHHPFFPPSTQNVLDLHRVCLLLFLKLYPAIYRVEIVVEGRTRECARVTVDRSYWCRSFELVRGTGEVEESSSW